MYEVTLLHQGENTLYKIENRENQHISVIKRYRSDRPLAFSAEGELCWLLELSKNLPVVKPLNPDPRVNLVEAKGYWYAAYTWHSGSEADYNSVEIHESAGRLLRALHEKGREILQVKDEKWAGLNRPSYDAAFAIWQSVETAVNSELLSAQQTYILEQQAETIATNYLMRGDFIHGDFHLGNLLAGEFSLTILDFDECGFGPVGYDLGTVRLHTLASGKDECWSAFLRGYGDSGLDNLRHHIAARILFMIGKIPLRFDVPGLQNKAAEIVTRYQGYISQILNEQ